MEPISFAANDRYMHEHQRRYAFPRLLADIGGTHARFALEMPDGRLEAVSVLLVESYRTIGDALRAYLAQPQAIAAGARKVRHAALAVANPVDGDQVQLTNAGWEFSIEALRLEFGLENLLVVNDFTALAMALPTLDAQQKRQVGGGRARVGHPIGLLGAGTGLGVSGLIPVGDGWLPLQTEGGHVDFSPADEFEVEILRFAWGEHSHVSVERLLSGMGLELIYRALVHRAGQPKELLAAPEISRRALASSCPVCEQAIECFCSMLGTVAGNLALTLGAKGGIYIGGGIVPRLGERFDASGFRRRFEQKGRFSAYMTEIPTFVITAENPAFPGVSALLAQRLV